MTVELTLTILFENPFWIGLFERVDGNMREFCKITFGPEPKACEVYDLILRDLKEMRFSPAIQIERHELRRVNPKRMQRQISSAIHNHGIGTKAQEALKLLREKEKTHKRLLSREQIEAEKERRYSLKRQKKKEKRKGR